MEKSNEESQLQRQRVFNENEDLNRPKQIQFFQGSSGPISQEEMETRTKKQRFKGNRQIFWVNQLHNDSNEPGDNPGNMLRFNQVFFEEFRKDPKETRTLKVLTTKSKGKLMREVGKSESKAEFVHDDLWDGSSSHSAIRRRTSECKKT